MPFSSSETVTAGQRKRLYCAGEGGVTQNRVTSGRTASGSEDKSQSNGSDSDSAQQVDALDNRGLLGAGLRFRRGERRSLRGAGGGSEAGSARSVAGVRSSRC